MPTYLFSVPTFTTITQLENGDGKRNSSSLRSIYIFRVISSLSAACAPFFGRLRACPRPRKEAVSGWLLLPQDPLPRHSRARSECVQPGREVGSSAGKVQAEV